MAVVTLTIDDKPVSAMAGETILTAAKESGISIPTLCHMDGVSDAAACRLCLVHVEGLGRLQAACVTAVVEGMVVRTQTDTIREYRRMILELLFAEGNHVCAVCVASGHCELQTAAAEHGMDHVRYEYQNPKRTVDVSHHQYALDHNRCIMCTRCVRTCDEIEGAHTWDVAGRGTLSHIVADMGQPWSEAVTCTSCGKCVQSCPTGALYRQGSTVAEMTKDREKLSQLVTARKEKKWSV
ncbi:bidirectional hydrogenase complex protein HoxU [soil metagenome]